MIRRSPDKKETREHGINTERDSPRTYQHQTSATNRTTVVKIWFVSTEERQIIFKQTTWHE